jgi:hypothetical protein
MSDLVAPKAFDFGDLPDSLSQAEALWHLTALSYVYALGLGYLTLMDEPDPKAAYNLEKAAEFLERSVRRAYAGAGEAEFLIAMARKKAREGVEGQRKLQQEDACAG